MSIFLRSAGRIGCRTRAGLSGMICVVAGLGLGGGTAAGYAATAPDPGEVHLPRGVRAVWDLDKAWRETTATRERVCMNGLWRWQPAAGPAHQVPADGWGHFKVPGCWPGITDYMQKDAQTVHPHPKWKDARLAEVSAAWYERGFTVPAGWAGRRIALQAECVNSRALAFVDGRKAGEILFPGGELDLTRMCRPGETHVLTLHVAALPLKAVMQSFSDTAAARDVQGTVERRGLCGDVFLVGSPAGARLSSPAVDTSVRRWEITVRTAVEGAIDGSRYVLSARVLDGKTEVKRFESRPLEGAQLRQGLVTISDKWKPDKLWDLHTPHNQYELRLSLLDAQGRLLDELPPIRFGFRELWIDGRDFYLNGSPVFLCAVPLDNAQVSAAAATYDAAKESMARLQSFGINFVYAHNYGCEPGAHLSFAEILRAADDLGMLVALTQPHFGQYDWDAADAEQTNGYARHADFYVRVAGNHPSVVMYSTSHNAAGYNEDMNPDLIDGRDQPRDPWSARNAKKALRAEAIIRRLDPSRLVYHHASGNLGVMHSSNFYPNFAPVQELSDWFEHWATRGVKPLFLCEYGAPFSWDWAMYRGWYQGKREFGSAVVPWEFCLAEWNAQFLGDQAYRISNMERKNLRWEAKQFRDGKAWYRWDYPHQLGSTDFPEREPVFARYYADNWRSFRTWGVSATSPWEHHMLFKLRPGMERNRRQTLPVDWSNLQRPGFSPDYLEERFERMDLAYDRSDWVATAGATALIRNNGPLLAWIAGSPAAFTGKDHNFVAGDGVEKQIVIINNSRSAVTCDVTWSLALPESVNGRKQFEIQTGEQLRLPVRIDLPATLAPGEYKLSAKALFSSGETQSDEFRLHVLPRPGELRPGPRFALFDPAGETAALLERLGIRVTRVQAGDSVESFDVLMVGKGALTVAGPGPRILGVREGLKVLVFEQTPEVLEQRLGFRVATYGLREVFPRVPDHPLLAGLQAEHLRDWRGSATLVSPRLKYESDPKFNGAPTVSWCGLPVTRAWRCGSRGSVASALIEKPARGDFLPILDGGFGLQYSPLLEYREAGGLVLFCQMDVSGRTVSDPAAEALARNLVAYVSGWKPAAARRVRYAGEPAGNAHLAAAGISAKAYTGGRLSTEEVLVVGPDGGRSLAGSKSDIAAWLRAGGHLLAVGLDQRDADAFLPVRPVFKRSEHIAAWFAPFGAGSALAGVAPADVHNRDPREVPLASSGADVIGNGVLARLEGANVVFCQLAPWRFEDTPLNQKRTRRRVSFLLNRLLANMGAAGATPILSRFDQAVKPEGERRWQEGLYLDQPEEWDDPYRFFRW